jgi:hypothetical protein
VIVLTEIFQEIPALPNATLVQFLKEDSKKEGRKN